MLTNSNIVITGVAGFIGFHLAKRLLEQGLKVTGIDSLSDYYDVNLKERRLEILHSYPLFDNVIDSVDKPRVFLRLVERVRPKVVIHLAAQAGVRYSIDNPRSYLQSNIIGTFEVLEALREIQPTHFLMASTSSVYGANQRLPYSEHDQTDHQISFYAATKKATENMAHSYSHLFDIPITILRFFTVYGPWGRPDMALFKFTKSILSGEPVTVYEEGKLCRDFTYIDDTVDNLIKLIGVIPSRTDKIDFDTVSPVAPCRIVNVGNSKPVSVNQFIREIESATGRTAKKSYYPMQAGDVRETHSNSRLLSNLVSGRSETSLGEGIKNFVDWYCDYYGTHES